MKSEEPKGEVVSSASGIIRQEFVDGSDGAVMTVLSSPELIVDILRFIVDGNSFKSISSLFFVSRGVHEATVSNAVWQEMCYSI